MEFQIVLLVEYLFDILLIPFLIVHMNSCLRPVGILQSGFLKYRSLR